MSVTNDTLIGKTKKFFATRQQIMGSIGAHDVPLNVLTVGPAGSMVVIGKESNKIAFYDFAKSEKLYASICVRSNTVQKDPGISSEFLSVALDSAMISLEWWTMTPR